MTGNGRPTAYQDISGKPGDIICVGRRAVNELDRASGGHAGPGETSHILAIRPDLVHMERVPTDGEGQALNRLQALREAGVQSPIWWYADHPTHYQGDASLATAEAGHALLDAKVRAVARAVRAIRADAESRRLLDEFYAAAKGPTA